MKYLCHLYYNTKKFDALTKEEPKDIAAECQPHDAALKKTGQVSVIARLAHGTAVTLRAENGRTTTTEGGRTGIDDQIGAFMIVEARDLNEAVRIASLHPAANTGEEDELTNRHRRQNAVDQVRRLGRHPPSRAAWAERAILPRVEIERCESIHCGFIGRCHPDRNSPERDRTE